MATSNFRTSFKKILMVMMAVVALAACSKGGQDRSARPVSGGPLGPSGNGGGVCGNSQQSVGRIFDSNGLGAPYTFEQRVKGLISASADPAAFGTISGSAQDPQTGVTLEGRFYYDNTGAIVLDKSNLSITIYDSFVGQKDVNTGQIIESYPITFSAASGGQVDVTTKTFTLQFKDGYGEVNFTGRIDGATVTGTIHYQNYVGYNNSTPASGVLGAFSIPTCAFVN